MSDPSLIERIRSIFLHEWPCVSIVEAAAMLGWPAEQMDAAIARHEIEPSRTCSGSTFEVQEVVAKALEQWPLEVIEEALARDAALVMPVALRTRTMSARLPLYQIAMLHYLAKQRHTTVGHVLTHQLDDLATDHLQELSGAIPGFIDAFEWPHVDEDQPS